MKTITLGPKDSAIVFREEEHSVDVVIPDQDDDAEPYSGSIAVTMCAFMCRHKEIYEYVAQKMMGMDIPQEGEEAGDVLQDRE